MKKFQSLFNYTTLILFSLIIVACSDSNDDDLITPDPVDTDPVTSEDTYLTFVKKYNDAITQPTVTLIGDLADDFEVIDAGYWESGNTLKFINGVVSLRYVGSNTVSPTAVIVRLKDQSGNVMAAKTPVVTSFSELSYILSGGSTFLRNVSPLTFEYEETADLGDGVSVTTTITSENNVTYAQTNSGKNVVRLVQLLTGDNTSNPDFMGSFGDFSSVELEYFTQTENITNSNALVEQRYFMGTSEIKPATGDFTATTPVYDASSETWTFSITNNTANPSTGVGFRLILQDAAGTSVAFEIDTNISFVGSETQQFTINNSDLYRDLSFLTNTEIQNLTPRVLLEW